ncbi:MAG TPA: response regulator transcription factor [Pyrinomonadaceae bacterium]|nr:response regulator transcription factor [Pyrinomonadaceae bacterium]
MPNRISKKKIQVYIADDHPVFLKGLRMIIEANKKLEIIGEAYDGETAFVEIQAQNPDVAVLDVSMPEKNGFEVVRALQNRNLAVRVIFLTMHDEEATLNSALDLGVQGYILKDSAIAEITAAIETVHKGANYISPKLSTFLVSRSQNQKSFQNKLDNLTQTETKILARIGEHKTTNQIAEELFVSPRTIDRHRYNICQKLDLHGINSLVKFAIENKKKIT